MPTHLRPSLSAATQAVAQPQKGSSTMSPSLLLALMMRSKEGQGLLRRVADSFLAGRFQPIHVGENVFDRCPFRGF